MIEVKNISKDFVSKKKYPGLKRVVKGLFTNEKYLEKMQENFCLTFSKKKNIIILERVAD